MFCSNCGKPLQPGIRFCTGCGTQVSVQADAAVSAVPPLPPQAPSPQVPPPQVDKYGFPVTAGWGNQRVAPDGRLSLPMPPRLHWFLVGLFGVLTCGIFTMVWYFIQTSYAKRIDGRSNATLYMALAVVCYLIYGAASLSMLSDDPAVVGGAAILQLGLGIVGLVFFYCAYYSMAQSLENELPKYGIRPDIGGITLFFFSIFYLQGQLTWLARWKDRGQKEPGPPKGIFWFLGLGIPVLLVVVALILGVSGAAYRDYVDRLQQVGSATTSGQEGGAAEEQLQSSQEQTSTTPWQAQDAVEPDGGVHAGAEPRQPEWAASQLQNPSFPCTDPERLNTSESVICHDAGLAVLDRRLAKAYREALASLPAARQTALKRDQARWIASRNECGRDADCLNDSMQRRHAAFLQQFEAMRAPSETSEEAGENNARQSNHSGGGDREASVDITSKNMNPPRYPPAAARAGIEGTVVLVIDVDANGNVTNVSVGKSSRNRDLDRAAMDAARKWRFNPSFVNGQRAAGRISVPVDFNMGG